MSEPSSQDSGSEFIPPNPRDARRPTVPMRSRLCPFTMLLIGASVAIFLLSNQGSNAVFLSPFFISTRAFRPGIPSTFLPEVWRQGQVWRLLTPMLIHFGLLHLVFNMFWLRDLGMLLERRYGTWRYAAMIILLCIGSSLAQYVAEGPDFGGMSGVIYGLFGYFWIQGRLNPAGFGYALSTQTVQVMMGWFFLCMTGFLGHVANYAHGGGLVLGAGLGWLVAHNASAEFSARRKQFKRAVQGATQEPLHRCHFCGRTEETTPSLEFRVSSRDGEEYCIEHLPSRQPSATPAEPGNG